MSSTATVAAEFKNNLFEAVRDLMADGPDTGYVLVSFGHPGTLDPDDIVSFARVSETQDFATVSTNRTRNEIITLEVEISCYRAGGPEVEQVASDRAYELLRMIETQVRVTDTTVGGTVWWCFLASHDSTGSTDPARIETGRNIDITAVFEGRARISS